MTAENADQVESVKEQWIRGWNDAFKELKQLLPEHGRKTKKLEKNAFALWAMVEKPLEGMHLMAFTVPLGVQPLRLHVRLWCNEAESSIYERLKAADPLIFRGRSLPKHDDQKPPSNWAHGLKKSGIRLRGIEFTDDGTEWLADGSYLGELLASVAEWVQRGSAGNGGAEGGDSQAQPSYFEGAPHEVVLTKYERDPAARAACLAHYGPQCQVCEIDFGSAYGDIGAGFIHVHHLEKLAAQGEEHEVDPVADLRPVCPNCHAMLHRKDPPYSLEEIATRLKQ